MPAAQVHADSCPECARRLEELKSMMALTKAGAWNAPAEALKEAKAIFVPRRPIVLAALTSAGAGARTSATDSYQVRREAGDVRVRLMIRPEGAQWRVMGQVDGPAPAMIQLGDQSLTAPSFEITVASLEEEIWLDYGDRVIRVPLQAQD